MACAAWTCKEMQHVVAFDVYRSKCKTQKTPRNSLTAYPLGRPLPSSQEWVPVLTNVWRTDIALDPLSALCVTFAFVCILLAVFVVRLSVISTLLLERGDRLVAEPIIHGFAVCILIG